MNSFNFTENQSAPKSHAFTLILSMPHPAPSQTKFASETVRKNVFFFFFFQIS